jgi:cytochrome b6
MKEIQEKRVDFLLNPAYYFGGITFLFFVIQLFTGVFLLMYFIPTVADAYNSLRFISLEVPFGLYVRTLHRYSAYGMLILCILHMIRMFITSKVAKPYNLGWITGVVLLFVTAAIICSGFLASFDLGAQSILYKIADYFEIGRKDFQSLILINFGLHLLLPAGIFVFLIIHFNRIARAKILPPLSLTLIILGIFTFIAGLFPISTKTFEMKKATFLFEKMFPTVPQQITALIIFIAILVFLALLPLFIKKRKNIARVDEQRCVGCFYCADACPKKAIVEIEKTINGIRRKIANVLEIKCQGCGVCVGACRSAAIQLDGSLDSTLLEEVNKLWLEKA